MAKPKLSDVAALAGVSPTTVSRVLNNRGYLSEATRTKVHEAVQQLGYRPNAIARSLQCQRSQTVGLIFPTVANPFYGEMVYQLENHLADAGYRVILCNSEDHPEQEKRYLDMLFANPVDGIITAGQTSINQAVMTGESLPVDKTVGDEVSSGTVNQFGAFEMQASKVGEDSSIQRMIRLVQSADAGKAKIVGLADRWATWMPPTLPWWTMR